MIKATFTIVVRFSSLSSISSSGLLDFSLENDNENDEVMERHDRLMFCRHEL